MSADNRRSEFRQSRVSACINSAFDFLSHEVDEEPIQEEDQDCWIISAENKVNDCEKMIEDNSCIENNVKEKENNLLHNDDIQLTENFTTRINVGESQETPTSHRPVENITVNETENNIALAVCGENVTTHIETSDHSNPNPDASDIETSAKSQASVDNTSNDNINSVISSDRNSLTPVVHVSGEKVPEITENTAMPILLDDIDKQETVVLRRKSQARSIMNNGKSYSEDDDGDDDDDDDSGVYDESTRGSVWVRINDGMSPQEPVLNLSDDKQDSDKMNDTFTEEDVFSGETINFVNQNSVRKESTATTVSEAEFQQRHQHCAVTKKWIQRKDSKDAYQRVMSQQFYDAEKIVTIEKRPTDADFGFHVVSSCPVRVSTVTPGGAAEVAGVEEGDIIVCVGGQNVIAATHDEVVMLLKQGVDKISLELTSSEKSDISRFKNDPSLPLCTGFLLKQSTSSIVKQWKRRWCILKQDNCLYIYKNETDPTPCGAIPLKNYTITKATDVSKKHAFKVSKYGAKTYYFAASSEKERIRWAEVVKLATSVTGPLDTWLDVSTHNVGIPALSITNVDCHGYLTKMGGRVKSWKKRYCVLKDACLYYYVDAIASKAKGVVHFHGYKVENASDVKKHCFKLVPPNETFRVFYFYTDSDLEKERWVNAMKLSIGRWVMVAM